MAKKSKRKGANRGTLAPTVTSPQKMGEEMAHPVATGPQSPNLAYTPRGPSKGGSIPDAGTKQNRTNHQERLGAQFAPQMPLYEQNAAAANDTLKNTRRVNSAVGNRDFYLKRQYGQVQQ